jgi:hypothetical protein
MMEAVRTSETSANINVTTRRHIPENCKLHTHHRESLKSHTSSIASESTQWLTGALSLIKAAESWGLSLISFRLAVRKVMQIGFFFKFYVGFKVAISSLR